MELPTVEYPGNVSYGPHKYQGEVGIAITVNASGSVESAKAISGHPYFRPMLEKASLSAKFKPLKGAPIMKAVIIYAVSRHQQYGSVLVNEPKVVSHSPPGHKAIYLPKPEYPRTAVFVGVEGPVVVEVVVDEDGNVTRANVTKGHPFFHADSLKAARAAKFEPLLMNGKPVRFRTTIVFNFTRPKEQTRPNLGIVNGRAINLPKPEFTQELRDLCAYGEVEIEVLISENGSVIEAKQISGDELLRETSLTAAKQATFRPVADGPPVRLRGILVYNFRPEKKCIDAGNVNGKWVQPPPKFSIHPHIPVDRATTIIIRIGIEPLSGKVLSARAINGHLLIRESLKKQALLLKFPPALINSEPFIVKGVIALKILPNRTVRF